ncbi:hypothetical protein K2X14_08555 [Acetobacter sp. TBRC 12305]|uniref:Transmembrane protein (PGPGW) n=1 Tax=Acetobacter garciniae TaxID=2817435 RepID=A0A939KQB2_9PROT|nr:hypothetical protein [Acetobacter garciniae]MBX0344880.1 hypothetical protein [Acetobacter garciniae]
MIELALQRLPAKGRVAARWLRQPTARWARIPMGVLLVAGSAFALLPVFGVWMLPVGLLLLAEDLPPLRRLSYRLLRWVERRRPHWLGLAPPPKG